MPESSPLSNLPCDGAVARIGLISDTHMPERCAALPTSLFDVFQGVDLILHAGDVGELWVLDRLSAIAPVVAVHGNDDTLEAQRELPYQLVLAVGGRRILLWHSHYPDRAEEMANRGGDWQRILSRQAERGRRAGAGIVIFGHSHVPMACRWQQHGKPILLVNPGALASGSLFTRQPHQTVALLLILHDGAARVVHVDLAAPDRLFEPRIDWDARFDSASADYETSILEPELQTAVAALRRQTYQDLEALKAAILPLCHPCWAGEKEYVTRAELIRQITHSPDIAAADQEKVLRILQG